MKQMSLIKIEGEKLLILEIVWSLDDTKENPNWEWLYCVDVLLKTKQGGICYAHACSFTAGALFPIRMYHSLPRMLVAMSIYLCNKSAENKCIFTDLCLFPAMKTAI